MTKDSNAIRRAFTLKELKTLFDKCPSDFWRYMVMAGFYCGQRMGDLICLPWGAVDFAQNQIRLVQSKTGKTIAVPLRAELGAFLMKLRRKAGAVKPSAPIWPDEAKRYEQFDAGVFSNEFYEDVLLPAGLVPRRTHQAKKKGEATNGRRKDFAWHVKKSSHVNL